LAPEPRIEGAPAVTATEKSTEDFGGRFNAEEWHLPGLAPKKRSKTEGRKAREGRLTVSFSARATL